LYRFSIEDSHVSRDEDNARYVKVYEDEENISLGTIIEEGKKFDLPPLREKAGHSKVRKIPG